MPKRTNPFGENSPLQYKTHVGKKEIDMGINMGQNMQIVYEKTKSLLYEGSKKVLDCSVCGSDPQWNCMDETEQVLYPLPGQMRLNPEGRLCKADVSPEKNNEAESSEMEIVPPSDVANCRDDRKVKSPVKQLLIGVDGKLHPTAVVCNHPAGNSGFSICHSCNRPNTLVTRRCHFCDKMTCHNCLNQCFTCKGLFCHVCSILNYDDFIERSYCLQCSGQTT